MISQAAPNNKVYLVAASANGDQNAPFELANKKVDLTIQDWGGFIGQWDNRQWSSTDTSHDDYGEMTGLKRGYIQRADLAWYCDHHHNAAGANVAYRHSYLFAYAIDLPPGAKTLRLPVNDKIRIRAVSVAEENPTAKPVQPLYDVLPSPNAGTSDFTLSATSTSMSIPQGRNVATRILVIPRGSFNGEVKLTVSGLTEGVKATFSPSSGANTLTLSADRSAAPASATVTITGVAGSLSHITTASVTVTPVMTETVPVDLSAAYNLTGIY